MALYFGGHMGVKHKDLTQFLSVPALCLYLVFFVYPLVQGFAGSSPTAGR